MTAAEQEPALHRIHAYVCTLCLASEGSECHVPGCMFWMHDVPAQDTADALRGAADTLLPSRMTEILHRNGGLR